MAESGTRLFFAVWPDDAARARLAALSREVAAAGGGRATRADHLHVTLAFLGTVPPALGDLAAEFAGCVASPAFEMRLDRLQLRARQRMAWATEGAPSERLADLARHLQATLSAAGVRLEDRRYTPHLTLARDIDCRSELRAIAPIAFPVREFTLVASEPGPGGSRYRIERRYAFATGRGAAG
jgi:RNA 2',3'-cyclic 3'-phosphodiesterase